MHIHSWSSSFKIQKVGISKYFFPFPYPIISLIRSFSYVLNIWSECQKFWHSNHISKSFQTKLSEILTFLSEFNNAICGISDRMLEMHLIRLIFSYNNLSFECLDIIISSRLALSLLLGYKMIDECFSSMHWRLSLAFLILRTHKAITRIYV